MQKNYRRSVKTVGGIIFMYYNFLSISRNVKILHNFFTFFDCVLSVVFVGYFDVFVSHKLRNHFYINAVSDKITGECTS